LVSFCHEDAKPRSFTKKTIIVFYGIQCIKFEYDAKYKVGLFESLFPCVPWCLRDFVAE